MGRILPLGSSILKAAGKRGEPVIELLTPSEMAMADARTIASGTPGIVLMEAAGLAVADAVAARVGAGARIAVACGPGNNGGDGFVAARLLAERGFSVKLALVGTRERLSGDAALAATGWAGAVLAPEAFDAARLARADVIVDALFGAGLARPLGGAVAELVERINASGRPVVAVDLPSGLDGATGRPLGEAVIRADVSVTFFAKKPGHVLMPGRALCGEVIVADIGIPAAVLDGFTPSMVLAAPDLWRGHLRPPRLHGHKYTRGHAVVVSGGATASGAARLAARGALRAGAGLVSLASPPSALMVNAGHLTAIMLKRMEGAEGLAEILADTRLNSVVLGPGLGVGEETARSIDAALASAAAVVLDADALTTLAEERARVFAAIEGRAAPVVLTPHEGEFGRVFPDLARRDEAGPLKTERAGEAARRSGAVVILKGADTVIAAPDGRIAVCDDAPADLATAGSGDVLAGIVCGLLARGMPGFEAAAAAVWLHGAAAREAGPGLIAEDLPEALPKVLARLYEEEKAARWRPAER